VAWKKVSIPKISDNIKREARGGGIKRKSKNDFEEKVKQAPMPGIIPTSKDKEGAEKRHQCPNPPELEKTNGVDGNDNLCEKI